MEEERGEGRGGGDATRTFLLLLERDDLRLDADGLDLQPLELLRKLGLHEVVVVGEHLCGGGGWCG